MFETTRWVCRSGSPVRESRWSNAAATSPVTGTCRMPPVPTRVNATSRSSRATVLRTAASWAAAISRATSGGAIAHSADTDFTGEKVRSYPATAVCSGREEAARKPENSAASTGSRPWRSTNASRATSVRIRARSSAGIGWFQASPREVLWSLNAWAVAWRRLLAAYVGKARPSAPQPRAAASGWSASGCRPWPKRSFICSSVTTSPSARSRPGEAAAEPAAGRLALLLVVGGQPDLGALGRVVHGDVPGEVRVAAAGRELVQGHHVFLMPRTPSPMATSGSRVHQVCSRIGCWRSVGGTCRGDVSGLEIGRANVAAGGGSRGVWGIGAFEGRAWLSTGPGAS